MTGDNGTVNQLEFKGIVRSTSAQNNADGNCEEIINMRHDTGVWKVVGKKRPIINGVSYESVYVHTYGNFENYIGIKKWAETDKDLAGNPVVKMRRAAVWFDPVTKNELQEICRVEGDSDLNQINNVLLVKDSANIYKSVFTKGKYQTKISKIPQLPTLLIDTRDEINTSERDEANDIHIDGRVFYDGQTNSLGEDVDNIYKDASTFEIGKFQNQYPHFIPNAGSLEQANQTLKGAYNMHTNLDDEHRSGFVVLSYCYQLFDGSETKMAPFRLINLGTNYDPAMMRIYKLENVKPTSTSFNIDTTGYDLSISLKGMVLHSLKVNLQDFPDYETYKDIIAQVNVYVSQPIDIYDWDNFDVTYLMCKYKGELYNLRMSTSKQGLPEKKIKSTDLSKILLYRVEEFKFGEVPTERTISFKNLTTNKTMPVDTSGWFDTVGNMFVYNNRLHLFNIKQTFTDTEQISYVQSLNVGSMTRPCDLYFYIKNSTGDDVIVKKSAFVILDGSDIHFPDFISFADSRAYKAEIYIMADVGRILKTVVFLDSSNTYNVSFASNIPSVNIKDLEQVSSIAIVENKSILDSYKILVSSPSNPYTFPPEQSYLVSGEILNLAVNTEQISASQIGMFPLYVFTTEGIYALQMGDGNVLYSNVVPVSAEVAIEGSRVFQTKSGIVFVTNGGLKLISGAQVADLSEPLKGLPDMNIRRSPQYKKAINHEYSLDITSNVSRVDFREYIREAVIGYDIVHDELIVSNPEYQYSYVYSFEGRMWHKITEVFKDFQRNICLRKAFNEFDVCDVRLEDEGNLPVWIQTRPINVDSFGFKTIYHSALRGELKPLPEDMKKYYGCYVFASNDLSNWVCVAQKITATHLNHAILTRIGKSFRYFMVLTGGYVEPGHSIALFEIEGEAKYNNRIR
ncbi:MAG: hypothetical protein NC410_08920 [Oscillibacter sp.]|nr:hypothetical protein [Oscillibacter sp.]